MDYATPNQRADTAQRKRKPKTAAPKRRAVPFGANPKERCRRGAAGQPALCPAGAAAYGFLKCQFLPRFSGQLSTEGNTGEHDFYSSFALLCDHYGVQPMETRSLGYPYNREVALWTVRQLLRESRSVSIGIDLITDGNGRLSLTAEETYCTGNTLYFIPVVPLFHLLQSNSTKKAAELLLCACAYLFHRAGVPYYRDDDSYLYWQYDMLRGWVEDEPEAWEDDSLLHNRSQLNAAGHIGDVVQRKLWNPCHLRGLAAKVQAYAPTDSFGQDCLAVAAQALYLLEHYPNESLYRHADQSVLPDYDADQYAEEDCITMDKYISFCAETKGWLYNSLSEMVNSEFGECSQLQEPVLRHTFDGSLSQGRSLDFEVRLFAMLNDLCFILNTTDYGTP